MKIISGYLISCLKMLLFIYFAGSVRLPLTRRRRRRAVYRCLMPLFLCVLAYNRRATIMYDQVVSRGKAGTPISKNAP